MYALLIRLSGEFGWNQIRRRSSEGIVYLVSPSRLITDLGSFLNLNLYRVRESFFYISSPFSRASASLRNRVRSLQNKEFSFRKGERQYWSEIRGALDQASSHTE